MTGFLKTLQENVCSERCPMVSAFIPQKHVLVVDDNRAVTHMISTILGRHGFRVTACNDGAAALRVLQSEVVDLVVTDYSMPVMNGETLCRHMRLDAAHRHTPVIMITMKALELDERELQQTLSVRYLLPKPFSAAEFTERVFACLDRANRDALQV